MLVSPELLAELYTTESLPIPAVISWPLSEQAEIDRQKRAERFAVRMKDKPPPGLDWMVKHVQVKYRPDLILPGCASVLVSALNYRREDAVDSRPSRPDSTGRIARYARGRDYHKELGGRLRRIARQLENHCPNHQFRSFTDSGPLDEVWLAEAAGLGFRGRHGLAILPKTGSWVVLGHILTTCSLDVPSVQSLPLSCPDGCRRCIHACPTGAISLPGGIDPASCLSYHTVEMDGPVPEDFREAAGDRLFGCDACQEACPFNGHILPTDVEAFRQDIAGAECDIGFLLSLIDHDELTGSFAGSPLMRAGRSGLVRNACTVAGNSRNGAHIEKLRALLNDEDEGIREHAEWAIKRME